MKMYGWILLTIFVTCISFTYADILRLSGSNQNTQSNGDIVTLPYNPPEFASNMTFQINITDDNNSIAWVNFTLVAPSGGKYLDNENGTVNIGDLWNSTSSFAINESGTWLLYVSSADNDTTNTTPENKTYSFGISDDLYKSPSGLTKTLPINVNKSYNFSIWTSTREYLNFSLNHSCDSNLSLIFNYTEIMVNSIQYSTFSVNLSTNVTSSNGLHSCHINITRLSPFPHKFTLPVEISISSNYGDIQFKSPSDYSFVSCGGTLTHSQRVTNYGNHELENCTPIYYNSSGVTMASGTLFDLAAGSDSVAQISYDYGGVLTEEFFFGVECAGNPLGGNDTTSNNPKVRFTPSADCDEGGETPTSPGGGSISTPPPSPLSIGDIVENVTQSIGYCGDGICDDGRGENPMNCYDDCIPEIFALEKVICTPMFNCGNWKVAWFTNGLLVSLLGGMVYYTYKGKKGGRLT